jgi:hypothetical protein
MERRFATLTLEHLMVPMIVPEPQRQKHDGNERAVNDGSYGKFKHQN